MENNTVKNFLITVEGVDGAGKSTYLKTVASHFKELGYDVLVTREPGGTKLGEDLREILLHEKMAPETETILMFSARKEHIETVIKPALERGQVVICDRYNESTYAYQGYGKNVDLKYIDGLKDLVCGSVLPDMTLIFDVSLETSKKRLSNTGKIPDKFESESDDFFNKVRAGYHELAKVNQKIKIINAEYSIAEVEQKVKDVCRDFVKRQSLNKKPGK